MKMPAFTFSPAHLAAAIAALLVSYGSSAVIIFQAAQAFGANEAQIASWFTIIGLVCGVLTLWLSLRYKAPVMMAWCTPGAAVMAGLSGISLPQAVAGFMFAGALMWLISAADRFDRLVRLIPPTLASAMLAGILINFGSRVFTAMQGQTALVLLMLAVYLLCKIRMPRYSILLMLVAGFGYAAWAGLLDWQQLQWRAPHLEWVSPEFRLGAIISVGVPLFIASLATQNVPGIAIMRSYGYNTPARPSVGQQQRGGDGGVGAVWCVYGESGGHQLGHLHGQRCGQGSGQTLSGQCVVGCAVFAAGRGRRYGGGLVCRAAAGIVGRAGGDCDFRHAAGQSCRRVAG